MLFVCLLVTTSDVECRWKALRREKPQTTTIEIKKNCLKIKRITKEYKKMSVIRTSFSLDQPAKVPCDIEDTINYHSPVTMALNTIDKFSPEVLVLQQNITSTAYTLLKYIYSILFTATRK